MELIELKKNIKQLVFAMANGIGKEHTIQFLELLIAIIKKDEAEEV